MSNRLIAMQPYFAVFIVQCLLFLVICVYPANAGTKGATFGVLLPILLFATLGNLRTIDAGRNEYSRRSFHFASNDACFSDYYVLPQRVVSFEMTATMHSMRAPAKRPEMPTRCRTVPGCHSVRKKGRGPCKTTSNQIVRMNLGCVDTGGWPSLLSLHL